MKLQSINKRFKKSFRRSKKQAQNITSKTEKGFEKYFLHRLGRLENVGRFVIGWIVLMILLIGGLIAQNVILSGYYQTVKPVPGGIYKEGIVGRFTNANPLYAVNEVDSSVSKLIFSGLFTYDSNGEVTGDLAESYELDSHDTTYTVKLKPNLKWHDGKPLTSSDVVFTFKTIQNPDVQSPLKSSWDGVKVVAVDAQTVQFTLPSPLASFVYSLSTGIIPEHILKDVPAAELRASDFNTLHPTGAGPFKWRAIEATGTDINDSEQQIALAAFENYRPEPPKLQEFVFHTYTNKADLVKAIESKQLTAAAGLSERPKALEDDDGLQDHNFLLRAATMVFFKTSTGILADPKVRTALIQSSDRKEIISNLGYETRPVVEPLLIGQVAFDPKTAQATFNLKAAQDGLTAAGWIPGKDGIRMKGATRLGFTLTAQNTKEYREVANTLKKQWRAAGVDLNVSLLDISEFQMSLASHTYDSILYGVSIGVDPDVFVYWASTQADIRSTHRLNLSEYKSKVADSSLEAGRSRTDPSQRAVKYQPFLKAWQADAPALGLYQPRYLYITNGPVDGLTNEALASPLDRLTNVNNWQIRQAKVTNP